MGRVILDNHNNETYCEPYDKKLMTKEELTNGIKFEEFIQRLWDRGFVKADEEVKE